MSQIVYKDINTGRIGICSKVSELPKCHEIQSVDGRECHGICEACGQPIVGDEKYEYDPENAIVWHAGYSCKQNAKKG